MKSVSRLLGAFLAVLGAPVVPLLQATDLVGPAATWRYLEGRTEASTPDATAWTLGGFNDQSWKSAPGPFFYGKPFTGTELTDMRGNYTGVYLRKTFNVADANVIGSLTLHVLSDDGFVAWINGKEVARFNVPEGVLAHTATALPALDEPVPTQEVTVAEPWKVLVSGENVLAIQALNSSLSDSTDFALFATATAEEDTVAPKIVDLSPPAGSTVDELLVAEVEFSEPVTGVDAGDLLVNGTPAGAVERTSPTQYKFGFLQPAPGPVVFSWKDGHGITDVLGSPHAFAGGSWTNSLDPGAARGKVMISEFMADDDKTLVDEDCDNSDWIEIYNSGVTTVNLKGWALTDDAADLTKWRLPEYFLGPDSYLIIFASQKNKTNLATRVATACRGKANQVTSYHTNFKLSNNGEYLALVAPDGEVVSDFSPTYPPQERDVSFGRVPGAPEKTGYFSVPTPKKANSATGSGFSSKVAFSHQTGVFPQAFDLTLTTADANSLIKFTLDGSFPAETNKNLQTYSAPLRITNTVQVRARAFTPGFLPGAVASETFIALTNSVPQLTTLTSSLPIIVITTLKTASILSAKNTTAHLSLYEPKDGLTRLTGSPAVASRIGLKTRGSSTGGQPQSNFAVDMWDEFDQDKDTALLGMPEDSEWVLYAPSGFDPMLIHNAFTMELSHQMDFFAPRTRFVEVYLNKGGPLASNQWFGLYVLMEKPGLSKGRVDAPKAQPEDVEFPEVTGSYMFKTDRFDETGTDTGFNAGGTSSAYVEPKETEMKSPQRAPQLAYLSNYFKLMDASMLITNPKRRDPLVGYRAYLEITNWMDFHLLETLSGQVDAIRLSSYFYKRRNGKIEYGPRWDYDRAWESKDDTRDDNPRIWDTGGGLFSAPWWGTLLRDVDAWQVWVDRWQLQRTGPLTLANMYSVIDRMTNEVRWAQPREAKRWPETQPRGSYSNETRIMKAWISNRVAWIDGQLAHPPVFSSKGASVSAGYQLALTVPTNISSAANVTMWYTLDGSDPRPSGGTGVVSAFQYTAPIVIQTNSRVVARLRDTGRSQKGGPPSSSTWSMAVAATFVVTPPPLVLSELMFHPAASDLADYTEDDFEFIELKNITDHEVNLRGYHFIAGVEYAFNESSAIKTLAPGGRVVLVSNLAAFQSRYPGVANVAGQFTGNLADSGERVALAGPVEETIFDFTYGDHWYRLADGNGFSLVPLNQEKPQTDLDQASAWRLSAAVGGSPGAVDPVPGAVPRVVVNEVVPLTAAVGGESQIELLNLEGTAVDVSGWWLSDEFDTPFKARLPAGSLLAKNGYLAIRERVFNLANGAGFSLNLNGDTVWLFSADRDGALTGWYHGLSYGNAEAGQSFGRLVTSTGSEHLVRQKAPSIGAANPGPVVGPVVFSEVLPHPPGAAGVNNTADEFVELVNIGLAQATLFDPLHTTNTWHLRGGVEFDFPTGITLASGGRLLVVGFDPAATPAAVDSLRRRAGLNANTPVVGPWKGALGNGSDTLRLLRPGAPVFDPDTGLTDASYFAVDEFTYSTEIPWPANTHGTGYSIARRTLDAYADDPANWLAALRIVPGTDADADGLPDEWETAHGLATNSGAGNDGPDGDPDGDTFTNRQELLNGTDPKDAKSALQIGVSYGAGDFVNLVLAATPGSKFRVEARPAIGTGSWEFVREVVVPATGLGVIDSEPATSSPRFFRVSLVP